MSTNAFLAFIDGACESSPVRGAPGSWHTGMCVSLPGNPLPARRRFFSRLPHVGA